MTLSGASPARGTAGVVPAFNVRCRVVFFRNDLGTYVTAQYRRLRAFFCDEPRYGVLAEFLAEQLFGRWSLFAIYDLGQGLRAFGRDEQRLKDMVALANKKVGDLSGVDEGGDRPSG